MNQERLQNQSDHPPVAVGSHPSARIADLADCEAIARIYNDGIASRQATFETEPRTARDIARWFDETHPTVVVEQSGEVVAFASTSSYRSRSCYKGVAEFSVYVTASHRRNGLGRMAMKRLMEEAQQAGFWKLVSRVFVENKSSLTLLKSLGFREVGIYEKHGQVDGVWHDVVIVERLL